MSGAGLEDDLCPMCGGSGRHAIKAPHGNTYIRIRADIDTDNYDEAEDAVNDLAAKGYELHSFAEDQDGTTWMMRWPLRWRSTL